MSTSSIEAAAQEIRDDLRARTPNVDAENGGVPKPQTKEPSERRPPPHEGD